MSQWPADNQDALIAFYGDPAGEVAHQLVRVTPPFQMYYDGRPLKSISFHRKAAPALGAALNEIWEHYGKDQGTLDKLCISHCAGTYNPRKIRGSSTRWSNHAFGAAIDLDAEHNGFNTGHGTMPQPVIDAFKRQGARWGGDYRGRTDPMHFEFCDSGVTVAAFADLPETDGDSDDVKVVDTAPAPAVAPDAPIPADKAPWWKQGWTWLSGGGVGAFGAVLYDWRVAITLAVVGLIIFLIVWPTLKKQITGGS